MVLLMAFGSVFLINAGQQLPKMLRKGIILFLCQTMCLRVKFFQAVALPCCAR